MTRQKFLHLCICIACISLLAGCVSGSSIKWQKPESVSNVRQIGLAPFSVRDGDRAIYDKADRLLEAAVRKSIEEYTSLNYVGPDSLMRFVRIRQELPESTTLAIARQLNLDAVLFCDFKFIDQEIPGIYWVNAQLHLRLVEANSGELIMESFYDTFRGNIYNEAPTPPRVLLDATRGAIKPVATAWPKVSS